jgi:hypothetical protein
MRAEYEQRMNDVYAYKKVLGLLAEEYGNFQFDFGDIPGYLAVFRLEESIEFISLLFLFGKGEWYILYRISIPASQVEDGILEILANLPWAFDFAAIQ